MQLETVLQSDPSTEVVVVFKYIPAQPMQSDCPASDAEIEFYSVKFNGMDIYTSLEEGDLDTLKEGCLKHAKDLQIEEELYNV